jgi:hypothetical protein
MTDKHPAADSEYLLVPKDKDHIPQAIAPQGSRPPEYVASQLREGELCRQYEPSVENNSQFEPRVQYQLANVGPTVDKIEGTSISVS